MQTYLNDDILEFKSSKTDGRTFIHTPGEFKRHQFNLSGGTDSGAALYFLCKYLTETGKTDNEIFIITGWDTEAPGTVWHANEIYLAIEEQFPKIKMSQETFKYTKSYWKNGKILYHDKTELFKPIERAFREKHDIKTITYGRTANPPISEQKKFNFYGTGEKIREEDYDKPPTHEWVYYIKGGKHRSTYPLTNKFYKLDEHDSNLIFYRQVPWDRLDKKFIAELYAYTPFLRDTIFPLTASCISKTPINTNFWTEPCNDCYWCHEKKWAFKCCDFGTPDYDQYLNT